MMPFPSTAAVQNAGSYQYHASHYEQRNVSGRNKIDQVGKEGLLSIFNFLKECDEECNGCTELRYAGMYNTDPTKYMGYIKAYTMDTADTDENNTRDAAMTIYFEKSFGENGNFVTKLDLDSFITKKSFEFSSSTNEGDILKSLFEIRNRFLTVNAILDLGQVIRVQKNENECNIHVEIPEKKNINSILNSRTKMKILQLLHLSKVMTMAKTQILRIDQIGLILMRERLKSSSIMLNVTVD